LQSLNDHLALCYRFALALKVLYNIPLRSPAHHANTNTNTNVNTQIYKIKKEKVASPKPLLQSSTKPPKKIASKKQRSTTPTLREDVDEVGDREEKGAAGGVKTRVLRSQVSKIPKSKKS
jgi:hypothetical protein